MAAGKCSVVLHHAVFTVVAVRLVSHRAFVHAVVLY
jgi:hypothetical protein